VSETRLLITADTPPDEAVAVVREWIEDTVPAAWREAVQAGRPVRDVRSFEEYEDWYPAFAASGLVVPTWPVAYGGLDLPPALARRLEQELAPYRLGRLNPLGLNLCAPALFAHGTEEQRLRYLPRIVDNTERWCQLFSEPGAGSDLASLACRAVRDGDGWVLTGQKMWTTWAHRSDWGMCLARTDPDAPKRKGITYFLVDMHAPGVDVRPLRDMTGNVDFNEVYLDGVRVPDSQRVGAEGDGWTIAGATLSGERQMVAGSGSGGVDRIGGAGSESLVDLARRVRRDGDPVVRQQVVRLWSEERIRAWTNARVRAEVKAGRTPGPQSSVGKVHQSDLNQRLQLLACDCSARPPWRGRATADPTRSRACSAAGPTASRAAPPR
jgi:alkylation response protein AidB-like acyl-CoA dehydrogenase